MTDDKAGEKVNTVDEKAELRVRIPHRQFSLASLLFVMALLAAVLAAWDAGGAAGVVCTVIVIGGVVLVRRGVVAHGGALLGALLGIVIGWVTALVLLIVDDVAELARLTSKDPLLIVGLAIWGGACLGLAVVTHECWKRGDWRLWLPVIRKNRRVRRSVALCLGVLGLCAVTPWIVDWWRWSYHFPRWETYFSTEVAEGGGQIYRLVGPGVDDKLCADWLQQFIPHDGRNIIVFESTCVTDQSIDELKSLIGTVQMDLRGTLVTEDGCQELRCTLPNCEIIR